jgi:hypothetical protein
MDVAPRKKINPREKIAQLVRLFGTPERGERANAWRALERMMDGAGITWSDVGNWIEEGKKPDPDESKYTEDELQQFGQARHAEGVEAGIKIGEARKSNGGGNGHIALPKPSDMAEYCHERLGRLKDDAQRDFICETYEKTQRGRSLHAGTLGYLVSLYMKHGGKFQC